MYSKSTFLVFIMAHSKSGQKNVKSSMNSLSRNATFIKEEKIPQPKPYKNHPKPVFPYTPVSSNLLEFDLSHEGLMIQNC